MNLKKHLLFVVAMLFLTSCSNDENQTPKGPTSSNLIGVWNVTEVHSENGKLKGEYDFNGTKIPINTEIDVKGKDYDMTVLFGEDPKKISNSGSFNVTIKIKLPLVGEKTFEQKVREIPATNGDWKVENNQLVTTLNGETTKIEISSFNNSSITFKYDLEKVTKDKLSSLLTGSKIEGSLFVTLHKQ